MYDLFVPKLFAFDPNFRDLINQNVNRNRRRRINNNNNNNNNNNTFYSLLSFTLILFFKHTLMFL